MSSTCVKYHVPGNRALGSPTGLYGAEILNKFYNGEKIMFLYLPILSIYCNEYTQIKKSVFGIRY